METGSTTVATYRSSALPTIRQGEDGGARTEALPHAPSIPFHGQFGSAWWTRQWLAPVERWGQWDAERLQRAVVYARRGLVRALQVEPGRLTALVQDARPAPYEVEFSVPVWTPSQMETVARVLAQEAAFLGELLQKRLPARLASLLESAPSPLALIPGELTQLPSRCSCPERALLCSHRLATLLFFASRLDTDPWLLLRLRGASQETLLALVRALRPPQPAERLQLSVDAAGTGTTPSRPSSPSPAPARWRQPALFPLEPGTAAAVPAWGRQEAWWQRVAVWADQCDQQLGGPDATPLTASAFWLGSSN